MTKKLCDKCSENISALKFHSMRGAVIEICEKCNIQDVSEYLNGGFDMVNVSNDPVDEMIKDMFEYHGWDAEQIEKGKLVREALMNACKVIYDNVPPSPDRSVAIRKLREARMDSNSAITHRGRY